MIMQEFKYFLVAVQFLTRIAVKPFDDFNATWLDRSAKYFPLVGAMVGAIGGTVIVAATPFLPQPLPMLLGLAAAIAVTGAFHEDGLADTADGLGGGQTREQRLEIMKDSRIGTYGTIALVTMLALKATAMMQIGPISMIFAFIAAHAAARLASLIAMRLMTYAGDHDTAKAKPLATSITGRELAIAAVLGILPGLLLLSWATLTVSLTVAAIAALVVARKAQRLIGGYTGDILGAIEQVFETAFLVAAAAVIAGPG